MKPSVLFILLGNENKASSRVRGYWIAEELEELGISVRLFTRNTALGMMFLFVLIPFYQNIVFQKTYSKYHLLLCKWAKLLGKTTALDIDDSPSITNEPITLHYFQQMVKSCSSVFAGSPNLVLLTSAFNSNTFLIPSGIRLKYYQPNPKASTDRIRIGWIGNGKYYKNDVIQILKPALEKLCKLYKIELILVGTQDEEDLDKAFNSIENLKRTLIASLNWTDAGEVTRTINMFDIGVYPLIDSEFNTYKCGFKALEYMALHIPVVSSRVAVNSSIIRDKNNGFIASSTEDWVQILGSLIQDSSLRNQIGDKGRITVEREYNTKLIAKDILKILSYRS